MHPFKFVAAVESKARSYFSTRKAQQLTFLLCTAMILKGCRLTESSGRQGDRSLKAASLSKEFDSCNAQGTKPRHPPVHRINHDQFQRSLQILFDENKEFSKMLPPDESLKGFKTQALALTSSPALIESYLKAVESVVKDQAEREFKACQNSDVVKTCLTSRLFEVASRAYRRPLLKDEKTRIEATYSELTQSQNSEKNAYQTLLKGVLISPQFMFRLNVTPEGSGDLGAYEKASRLAFFLWGGPPDEDLLDKAKNGELETREKIRRVVDGMVKREQSGEFIKRFTEQWLETFRSDAVKSQGLLSREIVEDMARETNAYMAAFFRENMPVRQILDAKFTYPSWRLAEFYGLPVPSYPYAPVRLEGTGRVGLLTQGVHLAFTSAGQSGSPVKRAHWILDRLLCSPTGAPPMMAEAQSREQTKGLTARERLAEHRANPSCAGCHKKMDPIGLSFEAFDGFGRLLPETSRQGLDLSGELFDGTGFESYEDLSKHLSKSSQFPRCLSLKLATYGLGRQPEEVEVCKLEKIAAQVDNIGYGLQDLIIDIAVEIVAN